MTKLKIGDEVYFIDLGRIMSGELMKREMIHTVYVGARDSELRSIYKPTGEEVFATEEQAKKEIFKRKLKGK